MRAEFFDATVGHYDSRLRELTISYNETQGLKNTELGMTV